MDFKNAVMVETMVPRHPDTATRIHEFYEEVGWEHRNDTQSEYDTYVVPRCSPTGTRSVLSYWQTTNPEKTSAFIDHEEDDPSVYSRGLALPVMQQLVEVALVVPSDEDVHKIYDRGGKILSAHSHVPPREHAGRQEFRFVDPFNFAWRVTANVGWELQAPLSELQLNRDIFTTTGAANLLGVSRPTLIRMVNGGQFPNTFHVGRDRRITREDIEAVRRARNP